MNYALTKWQLIGGPLDGASGLMQIAAFPDGLVCATLQDPARPAYGLLYRGELPINGGSRILEFTGYWLKKSEAKKR